jgi:hypothetical protein
MHSVVDALLSNTRFRNRWHGVGGCCLLLFRPAVVSMQQKNQPRDHALVALAALVALVALAALAALVALVALAALVA